MCWPQHQLDDPLQEHDFRLYSLSVTDSAYIQLTEESLNRIIKRALFCSEMMKPYRRKRDDCKTGRLAFIFLILFIAATLATALHHHDDGDVHHDCPVCVAGHHHVSESGTVFCPVDQLTVSSNEIPAVQLFYDFVTVALLPSRAPPIS